MPSALIEIRRQYPKEQEAALMEAVHAVMIEGLKFLKGDKNVCHVVHEPHRLAILPRWQHRHDNHRND